MTEIKEIYIAKHNDDIIETDISFKIVKSSLIDAIVDNSYCGNMEEAINNECEGLEICNIWYSAYDIVEAMGDTDDVYRSIVESSVDYMSAMDVGSYENCEIDDEDLSDLDNDPITFTAKDDGSRWNIAKIDDVYTIVPDDNKTYSACIVRVFDGVPKIAGHNEFNTKDEFESWLVLMDSANAMLLNLYEDDEKVIATIYL